MTYRKNTHDAATPVKKAKPVIGKIPPGKVGVFKGENLVGHCGVLATAVTAKRFGANDAKLGVKNGAPAWCGK
jgi:hypothetical protein